MKLGILNTCSPQDEADFQAKEFENFQRLFGLTQHHLTLCEYRVTEDEFPEADDCDAYLITGSPKGVYDDELWIKKLGDFIREAYAAQRKLIGICFGHQILAHSLGGHAEKSEKGWGAGLREVTINQKYPWMSPPLTKGAFYFCHQDQVMTLPPQAEVLAGNTFCPNGMFVIDDQVLGVQAHPEFTPEVMTKAINWLDESLQAGNMTEARDTVQAREADNSIMVQWIVNFLGTT
ncbi:MAG: hypothetical protein AAF629_34435 [Chloroflexota bacterium]